VCRRIRFTDADGTLTCWRTNTKAQRVAAPDSLNGRTGDPWTPVDKSDGKALTVGASGFHYQRLQEIFLGADYDRPPALEFHDTDDGRAYLLARTLVRGQGKTDGLHHRIVPVPEQASSWLTDDTRRERLAKRAKARVETAGDVRSRVLYPAIGTLLGGGDTDAIEAEDVAPWLDAFDRAVDAAFFRELWASVEMDQAEAQRQWQSLLWDEAQAQFEDAEHHAPNAATRYWRARSSARSVLHGAARSALPSLFAPSSDDTNTDPHEPTVSA
jgi:CRISPR system Cascade subunit CasA